MEEKKYKLGLAINAFEGTEHLFNIISEVRDLVDLVVVGLQKKSYLGEAIDMTDVREVEELIREKLVDKMLWIDTDSNKFSRVQECDKRNKLIDFLENEGCTHQLVIDSDEFYTHNSFQRARDFIYDNDIEVSYCRYLNYFGSGKVDDYKTYLVYPFHDGNFVPFISKISYRFKWQSRDFPKPSDPTRRYDRPKVFKRNAKGEVLKTNSGYPVIDHYLKDYYEFSWNELKMHHFSWIRNDIRKKMRGWSSRVYFHDWYELVDRAADRFQRFADGDKEGEAILLFNTPDNKVDLHTMSKQYVFPKVDIHERSKKVPNYDKKAFGIDIAGKRWDDIVDEAIANVNNNDWFFLYDGEDNIDVKRIEEIASVETDDSVIYSNDWKETCIGDYTSMTPVKCVMFNKISFLRMLGPDTSLLELSGVCAPLEIVGLSLRRYFDNISIDYKTKEKLF